MIVFTDKLAQQFRVTGVPKTVVNRTIEMLGALPEDVFVRTAVGAPEPPASPGSPERSTPS